jgi:acyl-CoA hydrolase
MRCRASRALKQCGISRRIHCLSLEEAVASVRPGDNCFVHTAMMSPVALLDELVRQRQRFVGNPVKFFHLHTEGRADYLLHPESFHSTAFFCAANDRAAVNSGRASFIPVFLSEVSTLWKTGRINLDVALLSVSPPDKHGMCSLGTSVDVSVSALQHAKVRRKVFFLVVCVNEVFFVPACDCRCQRERSSHARRRNDEREQN